MSTDLREAMRDLAADAPTTLGAAPTADLWQHGVRRRRRQRAGQALVTVVVVALVGGLAALVRPIDTAPPTPADVPISELHLPRSVQAPDPWAEGTDELGPPGRLAVLSMAPRNLTDGLWGTRPAFGVFGVSAVDGSVRFLDLPGAESPGGGSTVGQGVLTLSPDGTRVGYAAVEGEGSDDRGPFVVGWNVYDTTSGETTELRVPGMERLRGMDTFEIRFTGDSRSLLTTFSSTGSGGDRDNALVAWDVASGEPVEVEGTGFHWLPNPGSGPEGVVWSRGRQVFQRDLGASSTTRLPVDEEVVEASYAPDGIALAYIGHRPTGRDDSAPWRLYGGSSIVRAVERRIPLDLSPGQILGWADELRVVVGDFRQRVRVVDLEDGSVERIRLQWSDDLAMSPVYAADLWANPLVDGVAPADASDARWWLRGTVWVGALGGLVLLVAALVWWRRRARA
jgi:hypothetical protein